MALTSGKNRCRNFLKFSRSENKHQMLRRLFQYFQKRIESAGGKHVDFIHNINTLPDSRRGKDGFLPECPDIVNTVVGRCVQLNDIHDRSFRNSAAGGTFPAGISV